MFCILFLDNQKALITLSRLLHSKLRKLQGKQKFKDFSRKIGIQGLLPQGAQKRDLL